RAHPWKVPVMARSAQTRSCCIFLRLTPDFLRFFWSNMLGVGLAYGNAIACMNFDSAALRAAADTDSCDYRDPKLRARHLSDFLQRQRLASASTHQLHLSGANDDHLDNGAVHPRNQPARVSWPFVDSYFCRADIVRGRRRARHRLA